ncbi:MAG: TetR family transcriptional regulator [Lachnospiraceae bacterium]|nr:TetR family transcriptional regulator [Lachnospiraceae bacterium]
MSKSLITKNALAASLKSLITENNFDKVTIADITDNIGLNRQTFYYHFADKQELLYWIYDNEAFTLTCDLNMENWGEKFNDFLKLLRRDRLFYINTIKCSDDYFEKYLAGILEELFARAAYELDTDGLEEKEVKLVARFFSRGVCGLVIDWILGGMKQDEDEYTRMVYRLVENVKKTAYIRYSDSADAELN